MASQLVIVAPGAAAQTDVNYTQIEFFTLPRQTQTISAQVTAISLSAADATLKVQESNDGTVWVDISGATITLASGSSNPTLTYTSVRTRYIRYVWTHGTNASGTYGIIANLV